ncbi:hypothetical protein GCM10011416_23680 [Polaribacter pacificus]|uniref:Uncharacterized protein n=1 Tax=Polaribacter pacificus TaxID=1775173 RepID=A0A917I238_9FLAO|nr:hypothetical protein [Polaribacter pacificus]GGH03875.1 hypothetical protein GCM10011416_23680 [Polaribacter pacificus]
METNNIDKLLRAALKERSIAPSASAWDRLSDALDTQEAAPKKKRVFWRYAASIAILISVGYFLVPSDKIEPVLPNNVVVQPVIDTTNFVKPTFKNTVPVEEVIVSVPEPEVLSKEKKKSKSTLNTPKQVQKKTAVIASLDKETQKEPVKNTAKSDSTKQEPVKQSTRIRVNSADLLFAVTNSPKEVKAYYAKYNVNRDEVLKSIEKELQKTSLKIDAQTVLAEVERTIDEETFKKSFMQTVKGKITGLATAFSNRNN